MMQMQNYDPCGIRSDVVNPKTRKLPKKMTKS